MAEDKSASMMTKKKRILGYLGLPKHQHYETNDLPDEIWFKIFSHLDYRTIAGFGIVSKRCYEAANMDAVWKNYCKEIWLVDKLPKKYDRWRDYFNDLYASFGRYEDVYKDIKLIWQKIFQVLSEKHPLLLTSLKPGISEARLKVIEKKLGYALPDDLRCSYRICDGQYETFPCGLFGTSNMDGRFPRPNHSYYLVSLGSAKAFNVLYEIKKVQKDQYTPDFFTFACERLESGRFYLHYRFFGVILNGEKKECQQPDLQDKVCLFSKGLRKSQVVVYAKNFREFLQKYADDLENYLVKDSRLFRCDYFSREALPPVGVQLIVTLVSLPYRNVARFTLAIACTLHETVTDEVYRLMEAELTVRDGNNTVIPNALTQMPVPVGTNADLVPQTRIQLVLYGRIRIHLVDWSVEGRLNIRNMTRGGTLHVVLPTVFVQKPQAVFFRHPSREFQLQLMPNVVNVPLALEDLLWNEIDDNL